MFILSDYSPIMALEVGIPNAEDSRYKDTVDKDEHSIRI